MWKSIDTVPEINLCCWNFFFVYLKKKWELKRLQKNDIVGNFSQSKTFQPFHDGGPFRIETSPLICRANQETGFYMIRTSVMKELKGIEVN